MKRLILATLSIVFLIACHHPQKMSTNNPIIGGQKDSHGCLSGAGQQWSELKQDCIQVFNIGLRLNPVTVENKGAIFSAFVVFNDDKSKLELFLPQDKKKTYIINNVGNGIYQNDTYKFDTSENALYINGTKSYIAKK